jgi:hypothetical protein
MESKKKPEKMKPGPKPGKPKASERIKEKPAKKNSTKGQRAERDNFNRLVKALTGTPYGFSAANDAVEQAARLATQVERLRGKISAMAVDGPGDLGLPNSAPICLQTPQEKSAYARIIGLLKERPPLVRPQLESVIVASRRLARLDELNRRFLGDRFEVEVETE